MKNSPFVLFADDNQLSSGVIINKLKFPDITQAPFQGCYCTIGKNKITPLDRHDNHECWFIISGSGILKYNEKEYNLQQGESFYFSPNNTHQLYNNGDREIILYSIWW